MPKALYKVFILVFLPLCTGVLLGLSAIPSNIYHLSFVAFIPLLFAGDAVLSYKKPVLTFALQLLIALVVFYVWVAGYWILQIKDFGFLLGLAVVLPFIFIVPLYILFKKQSNKFASLYFTAAWLAAEMLLSYYKLGTPFYNLGNNLGANIKLIQWYEYTSISGGSLWILAVNFLLYSIIKSLKISRKKTIQSVVILLAVLCIPIIISNIIYTNYKEKGDSKEVLVIHPCKDNFKEKYRVNIYELMDGYLDIMLPELTESTEYVVLPETAITNAGWVKDFNRNLVFNRFYERTDSFPNLKLIVGAVAYEEIPDVEKIRHYKKIPGIRYSEKYKTWYYTYNTALQLEKKQAVQMRVKEGLIPYQEYAPYPQFLPIISQVGPGFQFSTRSNNQNVFVSSNNLKTTAYICSEVVNNIHFIEGVRNGARAFFTILNEGWYENQKISHQLLQHSVIRAIENRRCIAQASNMGLSAFINQRGNVIKQALHKPAGYLKHEIKMNRKVTLATSLGNYLGRIAALIAACLYIYIVVCFFNNKR